MVAWGAVILLSSLWTLASSFLSLAAFLIREDWGHAVHRFWGRSMCLIFGIRLKILFAHQIPPTGGAVLASNHASIFDIPILASLPVDFKWISKQEVRRVPFMGWAMEKMGCFFVARGGSTRDIDVLKDVENGLRAGKRVVIFPEGTRSRDGKLLPFKKGAFRLAQNAQVPLCPIAIQGSFAIAPSGKLPSRRGFDVTVRVGSALTSKPDEDLGTFMEKARKEIVRLLEESDAS